MQVEITRDDLLSVGHTPCANPLAKAITRCLGTQWCIGEDGFAYEVVLPHRVFALPEAALDFWALYQDSSQNADLEPLNFLLPWPDNASKPVKQNFWAALTRCVSPLLSAFRA